MSNVSFDVAVVGAGPAGSTAARVTAKHGLSTIVFESRSEIGLPVQCGEYLPTPTEMRDLLPHAPRAASLADVPNDLITNRCSRLRLFSPRGSVFEFTLEANVIDRARFDQFLARQAEHAGAEIHPCATVIGRTDPNVLMVREGMTKRRISAKVVVGADGAVSRIARSIGALQNQKPWDLSPTIQFLMVDVDCDADTTEMFFGNRIAPGGYAWIIPKGRQTANVGLGLRRPFARDSTSLRQYLFRFIRSYSLVAPRMRRARIVRTTGAFVPVGGPLKKTCSDSVILAGEAAGHVMASNGGGVPTALVGGEIAGQALVRHLTEGTKLSWYEYMWKKQIGSELYSALAIRRIADQVMISDSLCDRSMRLAGTRYLKHLIRCRLPWPVSLGSRSIVRILRWLEDKREAF